MCISRVSITCSGFWERWRCFRRRKKSATSRRRPRKTRAPRAIPTLAPVERPLLEEDEGTGLVTAVGVIMTVDDVVGAPVVVVNIVDTGVVVTVCAPETATTGL